jgi:TrmH family RNA methyltransferase
MLALVDVPPAGAVPPGDFCLLIDGVQDPGNVGSMLRSAAAAGVTDVLLSSPSAFAWSPKVLRAGQGAHFRLRLHEDVDLPAWASAYRAAGGHVVATVVAQAGAIFATALTGRLALAIGNEGAGLSAALLAAADRRATIPMPGGFESLNAAAAAAVVLFEAVRQRGAPGAAAR